MRNFVLFVTLVFISETSLAFDLKKLGDALQKDLGGALKQLDKDINQNTKPKLENDERAVANIVNNLCVITYTASNGKKYEKKSTFVNDCERERRSFLLNDAKQIESKIAYQKKMEEKEKEQKILQAKEKEERLKKEEAEKKKRIAANKIEGFNDGQSNFIRGAIVPYYTQYRNMKEICTEKGVAPYLNEVKKYFKVLKKLVEKGNEFPSSMKWETITDAAWKISTKEHEKYLKESSMIVNMWQSQTIQKRISTCKQKVLPEQIQLVRMYRNYAEKDLNKKDIKKEKKAF